MVDGPLIVCSRNPRYFATADDVDRAVLLTGSHVNNNLHDGLGFGRDCPDSPEGLRLRRLSRVPRRARTQLRPLVEVGAVQGLPRARRCPLLHDTATVGPHRSRSGQRRQATVRSDHLRRFVLPPPSSTWPQPARWASTSRWCCSMALPPPHRHPTTSPGTPSARTPSTTSPSSRSSTTITPSPAVAAIGRIRKVVDTVHDLPNVLAEVASRPPPWRPARWRAAAWMKIDPANRDSTRWQYGVIDLVKGYEREAGRTPHPIGMHVPVPGRGAGEGQRSAVAQPGRLDLARRRRQPGPRRPMAPRSPVGRSRPSSPTTTTTRRWRSTRCGRGSRFLRGHNPILYDLGIVDGRFHPTPTSNPPDWRSATSRRLADSIDLASSAPAGELASSSYVLTWPGPTTWCCARPVRVICP